MHNLTVGQEVRVFTRDATYRQRGEFFPGWPGTVTKVGRKLVTIKHPGGEAVFRLDTAATNDGYGDTWFRTLDEVEDMKIHHESRQILRERGITLEPGHRLNAEQLQALAAFARQFPAK